MCGLSARSWYNARVMPLDPPRETFIALRARREAHQISREVLYDRPIDVETLLCASCARQLELSHGDAARNTIRCEACGAETEVPPHLRPQLPSPSAERQVCDEQEELYYVNRYASLPEPCQITPPEVARQQRIMLTILLIVLIGAV